MEYKGDKKFSEFQEDGSKMSTLERIEEVLKDTFPIQLPKNILRDLIISMDRGERRFFALKLKRYNKKDKDVSSIAKLYEILSRHATPNRDEIDILRKHGGDIPHLEQVRQRLIKMILFALVEYRYLKHNKNIYISVAEILELLERKHIGAAQALFRRFTADFENTTNPIYQILIADTLMKLLSEIGPTINQNDNYDKLYTMVAYVLLDKAFDNIYIYREVVNNVNKIIKLIAKNAFPTSETIVNQLDQDIVSITQKFLERSFSVREFQVIYARILYILLLFRKLNDAQKVYEKIEREFDVSNLPAQVAKRDFHVELALSLLDWFVNVGKLNNAMELGNEIINKIKEIGFASDFSPLYLLNAYSKVIPVAWYTGNFDHAIELVEDGEYILKSYDDNSLYNNLAFFRLAKTLFIVQSAISYTAIGNLRFAKRLISTREIKKEIKGNKGLMLTILLGSIIVFAEANDPEGLQNALTEVNEIENHIKDKRQFRDLISIIESVYVYGKLVSLKDKLKRALGIATDMLSSDHLMYNAFYNSGFLQWLSGKVNLIPLKEAFKNKGILFKQYVVK